MLNWITFRAVEFVLYFTSAIIVLVSSTRVIPFKSFASGSFPSAIKQISESKGTLIAGVATTSAKREVTLFTGSPVPVGSLVTTQYTYVVPAAAGVYLHDAVV